MKAHRRDVVLVLPLVLGHAAGRRVRIRVDIAEALVSPDLLEHEAPTRCHVHLQRAAWSHSLSSAQLPPLMAVGDVVCNARRDILFLQLHHDLLVLQMLIYSLEAIGVVYGTMLGV